MHSVLITGVTGFLGAAIAEKLVSEGNQVIAIRRRNSDLWRCESFVDKVTWLDIEDDWQSQVLALKPTVFIHSAWAGVSAKDRDDWHTQAENFKLNLELLELAVKLQIDKFIGLGSQAEYGQFDAKITEEQPVNPKSAYGLYKTLVQQTIKCFSESYNLNWYWLRIFAVFGEKEDDCWFMPTVINNLFQHKSMDMTAGEQRYAYMYVKDLAAVVYSIVTAAVKPGVYNLSSANNYSLREVVEKIVSISDVKDHKINYGVLPYRENQSMLIAGDISLITTQIGEIVETDFDVALSNVVEYFHLNNVKKKNEAI